MAAPPRYTAGKRGADRLRSFGVKKFQLQRCCSARLRKEVSGSAPSPCLSRAWAILGLSTRNAKEMLMATSSSPRVSIGVAPRPPISLRALGTWTAAVLRSTTISWAAATRSRVRSRSTSTPTASTPIMTVSTSTITTRRTSRCSPRWALPCSACPSLGAASSPTATMPSPTRPASPSTTASSTACALTISSRS